MAAAGVVFMKREEVGGDGLEGCNEGTGGLRPEDVEVLEGGFDDIVGVPPGG